MRATKKMWWWHYRTLLSFIMRSVRDLPILPAGGGCWREPAAAGPGWNDIKGAWSPHFLRTTECYTHSDHCGWLQSGTDESHSKVSQSLCRLVGDVSSLWSLEKFAYVDQNESSWWRKLSLIVVSWYSSVHISPFLSFLDAEVLWDILRVAHLLRNSLWDHRVGHCGKLFKFKETRKLQLHFQSGAKSFRDTV